MCVCDSVPRSWLRGYTAYNGLLKRSQLAEFSSRASQVDVPRLLEKLPLEHAGATAPLLHEVLLHWHKLQCQGDPDYKLELQRFLAFLCEDWSSGEVPDDLVFGGLALVSKGGNVSVRREHDGAIWLTIPTADTALQLRCALQRAMTRSLSVRFGSALSLPCPLLQAAHEFSRDFLCVPPGFLDSRGDHERWSQKISRPVGVPARKYVCADGWVRIGIHVDKAIVQEHEIWDRWNVSFHAVHQEMLGQVIHSRMLLRHGDVGALGRTMHCVPAMLGCLGKATAKTKFVAVAQSEGPDSIEEFMIQNIAHRAENGAQDFTPAKHFLTSPSVVFASQLSVAAPVCWRGRKAQVLLQTRQRPDVTRVLAYNDQMQLTPVDTSYPNEELRWFTPAYGPAAICITGILFRFSD